MKYQIEHCLFDTDNGVLMLNEKEHKLRLKVLQLLTCLLNKNQQIVTRDELIDHIWDGNHLIGEKALNSVVYALRTLFKSLLPGMTVIETLPKRGYRFLLDASVVPTPKLQTIADFAPFRLNGKATNMAAYVFVGCLSVGSLMLLSPIIGL
ncbi:MAG: winged helix-turn-helix domain-containing protein [Psychrosphaera sp.]|nr:winged helix-turn-helix domain-containing protein [Psychrosphaera sp.]